MDELELFVGTIPAGTSREVELDVTPLYDLPDGTHTITITDSLNGATATATVNVNGDAITISVSPTTATVWQRSAVEQPNEAFTDITITNTDTVTQTGVLQIDAGFVNALELSAGIVVGGTVGAFEAFLQDWRFQESASQFPNEVSTTESPATWQFLPNTAPSSRSYMAQYALAAGQSMTVRVRSRASFAVNPTTYSITANAYANATSTTRTFQHVQTAGLGGSGIYPTTLPTLPVTRYQRTIAGSAFTAQAKTAFIQVNESTVIAQLELRWMNGVTEEAQGFVPSVVIKRGQSKKLRLRVKSTGTEAITSNLVVQEPSGAANKFTTRLRIAP